MELPLRQLPMSDAEFYMDYNVHLPSATIDIWGEITDDSVLPLIQGIRLMAHADKNPVLKELVVNINSPGGDFWAGVALYDAIRAYPGSTRCVVSGAAMSMGSLILQAGDVREATAGSTIMVHEGSMTVDGNAAESKAFVAHHKNMNKWSNGVLAKRSGRTPKYWEKKCSGDYYMTAEEALKEGLIDKVLT